MDNKKIVQSLKLLGQLMELHEENSFKVKTINNAAYRLSKYAESLADKSIAELSSIDGVGKSVAGKIEEIITKGEITDLEDLKKLTPQGVIEMLGIKGLGPKKIQIIWKQLEIESIGELYYACNENRLVEAKGFGYKTQEEVKKLIEFTLNNKGFVLLSNALLIVEELNRQLKKKHSGIQLNATGELKRNCEIITQLELTTGIENKSSVLSFFKDELKFENIEEADISWKGISESGMQLRIHFINNEHHIFDEFILASSPAHLQKLPSFDQQELRNRVWKNEEEIYSSLGLMFIPTPMREGLNEIELAVENKIPKLIDHSDLQGSLHNHSTWSDGIHTLKEMADHCKSLGYKYLGISDHSRSAFYANGLNEQRVAEQQEEIDKLNAGGDFLILKGIESDILNDGSLDYPEEVLKTFDFIVASVHSNLRMDEQKATERLIKAIENPYTHILGHPTGRLLLARQGYPIDHRKVIDACSANGVAIEINSNPLRLDLDWRWIGYALSKNVFMSINPDAHRKEGFEDMKYGVMVAQKGGLPKEFCLNTFSAEELKKHFLKK